MKTMGCDGRSWRAKGNIEVKEGYCSRRAAAREHGNILAVLPGCICSVFRESSWGGRGWKSKGGRRRWGCFCLEDGADLESEIIQEGKCEEVEGWEGDEEIIHLAWWSGCQAVKTKVAFWELRWRAERQMDTGPGGKEHSGSGEKQKTNTKWTKFEKSAIRAEIQETLQLDGKPLKWQSKKDSKSWEDEADEKNKERRGNRVRVIVRQRGSSSGQGERKWCVH